VIGVPARAAHIPTDGRRRRDPQLFCVRFITHLPEAVENRYAGPGSAMSLYCRYRVSRRSGYGRDEFS